MRLSTSIASVLAAACTALALGHGHVGVTTKSGTPGEQVQVAVGYLPEEADHFIDRNRQLMDGKTPWRIYAPATIALPGSFDGWYEGEALTLCSDYFYSSGTLAGGDFRFELVGVEMLDGDPAKAPLVWAVHHETGLEMIASTDGATREERSFAVGAGEHTHGQVVLCSTPGVYRLTLQAWDANGVYTDADPVTLEVQVGSTVPADLDMNGHVDGTDLGLLLGAWGTTGPGDLDGSGVVDGTDLGLLLGSWE